MEFEIVDAPKKVGRDTRWKDLRQQLVNLPEGKSIKVTVAEGKDPQKERNNIYQAVRDTAKVNNIKISVTCVGNDVFISRA